MDELKIIKMVELRGKLAAIPGKLLVAVLIGYGLMCKFDWDVFMENPGTNILYLIMFYGIVSYFWLCVRATGNWLIGFAVAFGLIFLWAFGLKKMPEILQVFLACAICFGGFVMDILHVIRYFIIKKKVYAPREEYVAGGSEAGWESAQGPGWSDRQTVNPGQAGEETSGFFAGCRDQAGIRRRYRDLCKVYHPDSGNGSPEVFNRITEEYNRLTEQK